MSDPQEPVIPSREPTQVRGILAERVIVSTPLDPFLSLKALASYSGLSVRKLRDLLADPTSSVPHYRVGGKILVRRSEFDAWMQQYRPKGNTNVARMVADVVGFLKPT
jgi:excisionase family DNA binding protein